MSIFEKIDMERHRRDINLCRPVSHPDATGYSGVDPEAVDVVPSAFFADDSGDDGTAGKPEPIAKLLGRGVAPESATSEDKKT